MQHANLFKKIPGHGGDCILCCFFGGGRDGSIGHCEERIELSQVSHF